MSVARSEHRTFMSMSVILFLSFFLFRSLPTLNMSDWLQLCCCIVAIEEDVCLMVECCIT